MRSGSAGLLLCVLVLIPKGASAGGPRAPSIAQRLTHDRPPPLTIEARDSAFAPRASSAHPARLDRVTEALFSRELEPLLSTKAAAIRKLSRTRAGLFRMRQQPVERFDAELVEALMSSASERVARLKESRIQGSLVGIRPISEERRAARRQIASGEIAAALSQLVERHTDDHGLVDYQALDARLGPSARPILSALKQVATTGTRERGWSEQKLGVFGDYSLVARVGMLRARDEQMGAFWKTVQRTRGARPLENVELLAVQHLFSSTAELVKGLVAAGLDPYSAHLLGKPYSTSRVVHEAMQADGFLHSIMIGATNGADRVKHGLISQIEGLPPGRRLLVVDDGGELLKFINENLPEHLARRVIGVEQTTRGITVLAQQKLKFPVVNVARSTAKQEAESPLIGRVVVRALEEKLRVIDRLDRDQPVLLLGYGTVGKAVANRLREQGYTNLHVLDNGEAAREAAARDGLTAHATPEQALPHGHVVVGLTGHKDIITAQNAELLPEGAVLVNGASRATEFSEALRGFAKRPFQKDQTMMNRFGKRTIRTGAAFDPARRDAVLRLPSGKEVLLASAGHVINFTGESTDPVPPRYIQLTSGLLYLGALQASRTQTPGLHDLEQAPQHELVKDVEEQLGKTGESLFKPTF